MTLEHYSDDYNNTNSGYTSRPSSYERAAERKQMYRRRKKIRRRIIASIIMVLIVALILFVVSLFIRVKEITITGNLGNYTYEEILDASGVDQGDLLLYINKEDVKNGIEKSLPYTIQVKVQKKLFSKIIIEVEQCKEYCAVYIGGKYVVLSNSYKVLDIVDEKDAEKINVVKVIGLDAEEPVLGATLKFKGDMRLTQFEKMVEGLDGEPFGKLKLIDVSDVLRLSALFENGLEIDFGNYTNLDYNIKWASAVVKELETRYDEVNGNLNLTVFKKAYYTPVAGDEEEVEVAAQ